MHCQVCPYGPLAEAIVESHEGMFSHPRLNEALNRIDEVRDRCTRCHKMAAKRSSALDYDRDGGKLHGEISCNPDCCPAGMSPLRDYAHMRTADTSHGCTTLAPDTEDVLRKAVSTVVAGIEIADSQTLLGMLRNLPLAELRHRTCATIVSRRDFADSVCRVLRALQDAGDIIENAGSEDARHAADKLVRTLCSLLTDIDAPILFGMLRGVSLADTARKAGMRNRATAHARAVNMLARLPRFRSLHSTAAK